MNEHHGDAQMSVIMDNKDLADIRDITAVIEIRHHGLLESESAYRPQHGDCLSAEDSGNVEVTTTFEMFSIWKAIWTQDTATT
jgi:hypothetical protein